GRAAHFGEVGRFGIGQRPKLSLLDLGGRDGDLGGDLTFCLEVGVIGVDVQLAEFFTEGRDTYALAAEDEQIAVEQISVRPPLSGGVFQRYLPGGHADVRVIGD